MRKENSKKDIIVYTLTLVYMIPFFVLVCANMLFSLFQTTYMDLYQDTEKPLYKADNPLVLLLIAIIFLLFCLFLFSQKKITHSFCSFLEKSTLIYSALLCLLIIFLFRVRVACDSKYLSDIAIAFLNGDYSSFYGNGYLAHYPHQLGMIGYLQIIYSLFGIDNFIVLQFINVIAILGVIYYLHRITEELFHDLRLQTILSLLCIGMLPLYLYSTFIYGDVLGLGLAVPAVYYLIRYMHTEQKKYCIPSILCLTLSIVFKSNNSVILIAFLLILLLKFLQNKKLCTLGIMLAFLIGPVLANGCINAYYTSVSGLSEIPSGIPKVAWIAMGLQENDYIENGWYNSYNWDIYTENNFDADATTAACIDSIKKSLNSFIASPKSGLHFFYKKFVSQWNNPGHNIQIILEWYSRHRSDHSPTALYFLYGGGRALLENVMNIYHFLILLGSSFFAFCNLRERKLENTLLSLCVFGGYLFHLIWEAGGRYGLGYYILCIPLAAWGLLKLTDLVSSLIVKIKKKS